MGKIVFRVKDVILDHEVSPDNVSAALLEEYTAQVATFLRGSKRTNLKEVIVRIKQGSLALEVVDELDQVADAFLDYQTIRSGSGIEEIDPVRRSVLLQWQEAAKKSESRIYELFSNDDEPIRISDQTNFVMPQTTWVDVEKYVYGRVFDLGGKSRANVHLELENGNTLKVGSDASVLLGERKNRLYKSQLVHIKAKQNIETGELKDEKLIGFEEYEPQYDEDKLTELISKGTAAWRSVASPSDWVESLRGNV